MRICFVAPANNYHTKKWASWFLGRGHEIHVVSFIRGEIPGAMVHFVDTGASAEGSDSSKLKYLLHAKQVRRIIEGIQPDVISVHYATSYGAVMALSGVKPYVLSVWGSDIYDFPRKSPLHKALLKFSLRRAAHLFSTSQAMADEGAKYTNKRFEITPFGVDLTLFGPGKRTRTGNDGTFVVGTVKGLSDKYGIGLILRAVAEVRDRTQIPIRLRIAGKGPQEQEYKQLARELKIDDITMWLGFISQEKAAMEWANMDVGVIPSTLESESFGVSAIEAQACGTPVIISDIPGLMEATDRTAIIVPRNNHGAIVDRIIALYEDPDWRERCRKQGLANAERYELNKCFSHIEKKLIEASKKIS